ncbi:MAG: hypothetical protein P8N19_03420 [Flavobacteriales bacterium]|nr:hypothetical protein [Flavobacteriales bacterium]
MNDALSHWYKYALLALISVLLPLLIFKAAGVLPTYLAEVALIEAGSWKRFFPLLVLLLSLSYFGNELKLPLKYYLLSLIFPLAAQLTPGSALGLSAALFLIALAFDYKKHQVGSALTHAALGFLFSWSALLLPVLLLNAALRKEERTHYLTSSFGLVGGVVWALVLGFKIQQVIPTAPEAMFSWRVLFLERFDVFFLLMLAIALFLSFLFKRGQGAFLHKSGSFSRTALSFVLLLLLLAFFLGGKSVVEAASLVLGPIIGLYFVYFDSEERGVKLVIFALIAFVGLACLSLEEASLTRSAQVLVFIFFLPLWMINRTWSTFLVLLTLFGVKLFVLIAQFQG